MKAISKLLASGMAVALVSGCGSSGKKSNASEDLACVLAPPFACKGFWEPKKKKPAPSSFADDSTGQGFEYQSFGAWSNGSGSRLSASSTGQVTPAAAVPSSGNAKFSGQLIGVVVSSGTAYGARAGVVLDADFGARSVAIASHSTVVNGRLTPNLNLDGVMTYAPGSSSFSGAARSGNQLSGSIRGAFYGPEADEAGGTFSLKSPRGEKFVGAYGAKR